MNTKSYSRTAGILLLLATAASIIDRSLIAPLLDRPDYLTAVLDNESRMVWGAFIQVVAGLASAAIALAFYPVVRWYAAGLAIGSVAFRVIEGTLYLGGALGALLIVALAHAQLTGADGPTSMITGQVLLSLRDRSSEIGILAFYIGGTLYYAAFLRHHLLPRWLSVWGLVGTALGFVAGILAFLGVIGFLTTPQVVLNLPIGLNEIVLAFWLLTKGFSTPPTPVAPPTSHHLVYH